MCSRPMEDDSITHHAVDQEPVRVDMAFDESGEFIFQCMFPECFGERYCRLQQPNQEFERFVFESIARQLSFQAAEVAFELPREDDFSHKRFRCATASLAVLKR